MAQERFSTLEECCEFARRFDQLAEQKSKEEIKEDVIAMHIALVKHIDEIVNRVYTRHKLSCKCKWALNYTLRYGPLGKVDSATRYGLHYKPHFFEWGQNNNNNELLIHINPRLLFSGADTIRSVVLHEIAHLSHMNHGANFWKTHIIYMQEEGLLPQGDITKNGKLLFLNGKAIAESGCSREMFGVLNPFLGMYVFLPGKKHFRIKRKMKTIVIDAIYSKQLNINIVCNDKR